MIALLDASVDQHFRKNTTLVPAEHLDSRVSPFLLQVKEVRTALHQLRVILDKCEIPEFRVPVLSLEQVFDVYSLQIKYLRRHTLTVLLSQSRVAEHFLQNKVKKTLFLELQNGLTIKELTITLDKCCSLESYQVC